MWSGVRVILLSTMGRGKEKIGFLLLLLFLSFLSLYCKWVGGWCILSFTPSPLQRAMPRMGRKRMNHQCRKEGFFQQMIGIPRAELETPFLYLPIVPALYFFSSCVVAQKRGEEKEKKRKTTTATTTIFSRIISSLISHFLEVTAAGMGGDETQFFWVAVFWGSCGVCVCERAYI